MFTYSRLRKVLEKETEKQVDAFSPINFSNKEDDELKQMESIFSKNLLNNLNRNKALKIVNL